MLEKRARYRQVYHQFDIAAVVAMTDDELEALLEDAGIIRNRLKVFGFRKNAQAAQKIIQRHGSLAQYLWQFVDGQSVVNRWQSEADVPAQTGRSDAMSRQLKKRRLHLCGEYYLLRIYASQRDGKRPCGGLLAAPRQFAIIELKRLSGYHPRKVLKKLYAAGRKACAE